MIMKKISLVLVFSLLFALLWGCDSDSGSSAPEAGNTVPFTVRVMTEGGMPLEELEVRIFAKENNDDLVWAGETDEEGYVHFKGDTQKEYMAVLNEIPEGYKNNESYDISEDCIISLETEILDDFFGHTYKLGSIVRDFSVTDVNGNSYNISELLQNKKAVVLNFWFLNCGPCRMEFPYLQSAYEVYKNDIEVLAINPLDGTDATVSDYAQELELTFPVSADDRNWDASIRLTGFPTTVVIDRYGMISMVHMGAVTEYGVFERIFEYYISEDYVQSIVRNISDIE